MLTRKEGRRHNSTYKKLAVQWLNEALCFVSSFVVADSLVLRNRQLLVAANRYLQAEKPTAQSSTFYFFRASKNKKSLPFPTTTIRKII